MEPQHLGHGPLGHPERAGQVGVDHVEERLVAHPQHQRIHGDAGVGHEDLDRAPPLLDRGEGRVDLLRVAHVAANGQEAVRVGADGRLGWVRRAVGRGDPVAVGQEPLDAGRADAAGPAGDEDDGHQRLSGTRSQTSGWPSWTRSPSAASQRMTCPAKGVRTSETPDPADQVPDVDGGRLVGVVRRSRAGVPSRAPAGTTRG